MPVFVRTKPILKTSLGLAAALIAPLSALADPPVIGPQVRVDVGGGRQAANETSAASVDGAPNEIVATANDWRESTGNEIIRMSVAVSNDFGATWTDFLVRPPGPNQSSVEGDPMSCYDPRTGTLWVGAISFAGNGGLYVARKDPGLNTFQPSVMARATGGADKGWMAAGIIPGNPNSTRVYIAYNQGVIWSDDMGLTWNTPRSVGTGIGFLPRVGPEGELYVTYWDFGTGVMLRRSFDGGNTFDPALRIATRLDTWSTQDGSRFPGTFRVPPLNSLAVDPVSGVLYCVYFDTTNIVNGQRNVDLYFSKSTDKGSTWSAPRVINGDNNPPGDQFFPWLEVDRAGRIHMLFYDSRHTVQNDGVVNGMFDAYYTMSADGGATWSEHRLTPQSFNSDNDGLNRGQQFFGDYNGLGLGGDFAYPNYVSSPNGDTDMFVHTIRNRSLALEPPSPGRVNEVNSLVASNATPGATVYFAYGLSSGVTNVPGCSGLAVFLGAPAIAGSAVADGSGVATLSRQVGSAARGRTIFIQAVEQSSCTPSNVVKTVFE